MHGLGKAPHGKSKSTSRKDYQQVPLTPESDSEDDETLLYSAPMLNEQDSHDSSHLHVEFGDGLYDHSCDLDLPRVRQFHKKGYGGRRRSNLANSKSLVFIFVVVACMIVALIGAFAVFITGNWSFLVTGTQSSSSILPSSSSILPLSCSPTPQSLANRKMAPCQTTPSTSVAPPSATPSLPPPSTKAEAPDDLRTTLVENDIADQHTPPPTHPPSHKTTTPTTSETTNSQTLPSAKTPPTKQPPPTEQTPPTKQTPPTEQTLPSEKTTTTTTEAITTEEKPQDSHPNNLDPNNMPTPQETCYPIPTPIVGGRVQPCPTTQSEMPSPTPLSSGVEQTTVTTPTIEITTPDPLKDLTTPPLSPGVEHVEETATGDDIPTPEAEFSPSSEAEKPTSQKSDIKNMPSTNHQDDDSTKPGGPLSWDRRFMPAVSESTPVVYDLNGDGVMERFMVEDFSQCATKVSALNGLDGSTVWQREVQFPVFAVSCILDVNEDGTLDCVVSGRGGGFAALDGVDGHFLWVVDRSLVFPLYNFFFPLLVADWNQDGIDDLVNIHGGDQMYEPEEQNRSPAFLVVVSGKTGQKLMDPVPMPDGHESYMSPVLFEVDGKDQLVIFGSGGETVPGSLWGVGLASLKTRVTSYLAQQSQTPYQINFNDTYHMCFLDALPARPAMDLSLFDLNRPQLTVPATGVACPTFGKRRALENGLDLCLYELVRSVSKGVMLPPVMVDLTRDGVRDLVVSTFDGHTMALDGKNPSVTLWDVYYPGTESYSVPAPLFYNSDDVPDVQIRTNVGTWSDGYTLSVVRVLDGRNGSELWSFDTTASGHSSTVSVVSKTHGRDALVFLALGQTAAPDGGKSDGDGVMGSQDPRRKRSMADINIPDIGNWPENGEAERDDENYPNDEVDRPDPGNDMFTHAINFVDPPDLWVSTPDDPLPDIITLATLMEYCGMTVSDWVASLYVVNREMIESGIELVPLTSYEPYLYFKPGDDPSNHSTHQRHVPGKRHAGENHDNPMLGDGSFNAKEKRQSLRCAHISLPSVITGTPLLGDLNSDGRLDIVYDVVWSPTEVAPPQVLSVAEDLQVLFDSVYGNGILDFGTFLSPERQPWPRYMGKGGKGRF